LIGENISHNKNIVNHITNNQCNPIANNNTNIKNIDIKFKSCFSFICVYLKILVVVPVDFEDNQRC